MKATFDVAVIGSGFAGSLLAMIVRRLGRSVVLLERGRHPRFAIGESSTPLANLLLEQLARRYDLPALLPLTEWGRWQATYPQIACGLKRGFTFFHHDFDHAWQPDPERRRELLVAASPCDAVADTHWYRPDFDAFLVRHAQELGVEFLDDTRVHSVQFTAGHMRIESERHGHRLEIDTAFVCDASGPRGCLHRALGLGESPWTHLPRTLGLYSHFRGVHRWDDLFPNRGETPPYPVDDAAVHHVFDGGWIWVLRFNNGLTSAGVAATTELADTLRLSEGAPAWDRLLARLPSVRAQFRDASPLREFDLTRNLSFCSERAAGERWALLPSAAGFVDPLLSTGFPLTLLGVGRLAEILEAHFTSGATEKMLAAYERQTLRELAVVEKLVAALYANLHDFPVFRALTRLYFAAASYTETAHRLRRPELAGPTFLMADHPHFGPAANACLDLALARQPDDTAKLLAQIDAAIEPIDIAGLRRPERRHWYPVRAEDLVAGTAKLNATRQELEPLLAAFHG